MSSLKNRYFIAIIPPTQLCGQLMELKNYFHGEYQSKASLNSPPHITLHMPFEWKKANEGSLKERLLTLASTLSPVNIVFKNFGSFEPRVIFVQVAISQELTSLQFQVRRFCKTQLGLFNADYKDLPFHPHLTLAFRDLKKAKFAKAWQEFEGKAFDAEFLADHICLLKHDGKKWHVTEEFPLVNPVAAKS